MPETPDFDRLAARLEGETRDAIAEALRQIWNARGAADLATIETALHQLIGASSSGLSIKHLDRALRTLDR